MHGVHERKLAADLAKLFQRQADAVASRIEQLQTLETDAVFDADEWESSLVDVLRSHLLWSATIAAELEQSQFKNAKIFDRVAAKIKAGVDKVLALPVWKKVADTTRGIVDKALSAAKQAGQSVADAVNAVRDALGGKAAEARAADLARTEITAGMNLGSEAVREYEAELGHKLRKQWLTQGDGKVREAHAETDGQIVGHGQNFSVGGHPAAYPGDWNLPAELRCGCRCWAITLQG